MDTEFPFGIRKTGGQGGRTELCPLQWLILCYMNVTSLKKFTEIHNQVGYMP